MNASIMSHLPAVHVRHGFLPDGDHAKMLADALAHEHEHRPSCVAVCEHGEVVSSAVKTHVRLASSRVLDKGLVRMMKREIVASMAAVEGAIGVRFPEQFGLEVEAVHSGDGAFFGPHIDTLRGFRASHRVISAVYYFARQPKGFSGGQLRLWSLDKSRSVIIEPEDNSMVFFPSIFLHEVLPVSVPSLEFADGRFSVNCWIHRNL